MRMLERIDVNDSTVGLVISAGYRFAERATPIFFAALFGGVGVCFLLAFTVFAHRFT